MTTTMTKTMYPRAETSGRRSDLIDQLIREYGEREKTGNPLESSFNGLGYVVFKRTYARRVEGEDRTEEWHETVGRVVRGAVEVVGDYTPSEIERLYDHIWSLRALPSGRALWQLGTQSQRRLGADSLVNCWFVRIQDRSDFVWMFDRLMLGGGVGFDVRHASDLGPVAGGNVTHTEPGDSVWSTPDSREGWSALLEKCLEAWFDGGDFAYSTERVRPEGAPIKGFGGIASGPGILIEGIEKIGAIFGAARGRELTSVEVLDICNLIGSIVVSGNVRRSAQIAIGSPEDEGFLRSKTWELGIPAYRAMSNNSVYVTEWDDLGELFWDGYRGKGEPFGIVNLERARTDGRLGEPSPDPSIGGFNPCGEIGLGHRESCNLAELVLPRFRSFAEVEDAATLLYRLQKAIAALPYLDGVSEEIAHRNMRLGLSVTGVFEASRTQLDWLDPLYQRLRAFDREYSEARGWPVSVRLTTVQPSGTKSLLSGTTPGAHPGFSRFHIRRVRMAHNDPTLQYVRARGYPVEPERRLDGTINEKTLVVEFPCEFPYGTPTANMVTWKDMLKMQEFLQTVWADNAVSITVYYKMEELPEIQEYMREHWHKFKSVSFLPKEDHGFVQAPLEAISIPEYERRLAALDMQRKVEIHGEEVQILDSDCDHGACPIR